MTGIFCSIKTKMITIFALAVAIAATTALPAIAGPPLLTDDAGVVEVGKVELELNGSYIFDKEKANGSVVKRTTSGGEVKISTGLYNNLSGSLALPYTFSNRATQDGNLTASAEGFGDMTVDVKYVFAELAGVNFAIKPSVIVPSGKYSAGLSDGRWQFGGSLIASREFDEGRYALHANLGYENHEYRAAEARATLRNHFWSGSVAGEIRLLKELTVGADVGLATTTDKSTSELTVYALTGMRYELNRYMDINAGIKFGLTKPEDDITAIYGVVFKF